jgi:hypothetical protein
MENLSQLDYVFPGAVPGASFLLSGMEAGVFALNRLRVRRLARAGKPSAQMLNGFWKSRSGFCGRFSSATRSPIFHPRLDSRQAARMVFGPHGLDLDVVAVRRSSCFCFTRFSICCPKCFSARIRIRCACRRRRSSGSCIFVEPAGVAGRNVSQMICAGRAGRRSRAGCSATARKCAR